MAKWGEGDPRWIVEERPDATNVNNWHWTEKNATPWSKERFIQLFKDFKIDDENIICTIDELKTCTGEAAVNNRKGKLIFFYEWNLVLKWSGKLLNNSNMSHNGEITIPNLSEENDLDEIEITISIDESNDESETLKQFMYNIGRGRIRERLGLYIRELKEEYSKNLILPKKGEDTSNSSVASLSQGKVKNAGSFNRTIANTTAAPTNTSGAGNGSLGYKLNVKTLEMHMNFHCSANDIYNVLTKSDLLMAFTRAGVKVDATRGGEFVLYDGNVQGQFRELIPEKKIEQTWRLKSWPSGHYSTVLMEIEQNQAGTRLALKQTGIPAAEFETMEDNWRRYYWNSINQTFGFGADIRSMNRL